MVERDDVEPLGAGEREAGVAQAERAMQQLTSQRELATAALRSMEQQVAALREDLEGAGLL